MMERSLLRVSSLLYAEPQASWRWVVSVAGVLLVLGIAFVDHALGPEVSLIALHVIPVAGLAWYGKRWAGYVAAAAAALGLVIADRMVEVLHSSAVFAYWDSVANGLTLATVALPDRLHPP
ncbi:MAG: hypothetical protein U5L11_17095 [Arhodomonas sp.]|nr:hypothetical protein [Arhodomonas sp.]